MINDHRNNGLSQRTLSRKYGISKTSVQRLMKKATKQQEELHEQAAARAAAEQSAQMPDDIQVLKEELRKARLKIELQDIIIEVASKELGVDIRKKSGIRQSP